MISTCPHCQQQLGLTDGQKQQIKSALATLEAGKKLKLACPKCQKPIEIGQDAAVKIDTTVSASSASSSKPSSVQEETGDFSQPLAPDISWLTGGELSEKDIIDDVPQVLVLINDEVMREKITDAFEAMGYKPECPGSPKEAIARMRFVEFDAVVLHVEYEGSLEDSTVHSLLKSMMMPKRRRIYYMLIGPDFHTFYGIEALAHSANLVVNESEIDNIGLVLRKGLRDYEELFGPFLAALEAKG
jgi:hypothetical protein